MAALNDDAMIIETGNLWVGDDVNSLVDMGALRNIRFTSEPVTTVINSDNRGEILRKSRMPGRIEAELLEIGDVDTLENIFKGLVTKSSVAGTIVNNHPQVIAAGDWNYDVFIEFEHQDADGTYPNVDSVVLGTDGAIVLNTDYFKAQNPATGAWGIVIRDSSTVTTENQTVTITYDYTPAATKVITGGSSQTAIPRYVKIIAPSEDDSNVTREIIFESALATSPMLLPFTEVESAGDVGMMPVVFETRKGTDWYYRDEISVA